MLRVSVNMHLATTSKLNFIKQEQLQILILCRNRALSDSFQVDCSHNAQHSKPAHACGFDGF